MSVPAQVIDPADASEPSDLSSAGVYPSRHAASEHGLVVLAMGLPYWLDESGAGFGVLVESAQIDAVRRELALFDSANVNWPPAPTAWPAARVSIPWFTPLLWAGAVLWAFLGQWRDWDRVVAWGALDGSRVWIDGEWWRLGTALFLHADLMHVAANIAIGVFVFTQVIIARGIACGWLELAAASLVANALNAAIRLHDEVSSIGASTAVFAGIGLLTGIAVRAGWQSSRLVRWRSVFVPWSAGFILLALLGVGGERTDVTAHLAGFVVGCGVGLLRALSQPAPPHTR